jgi:hypothetical protein
MLVDAHRISWWTSPSKQAACHAMPRMMAVLHPPRMRIGAFNPLESVPGVVRQNKHATVVLTAGRLLGRNSEQQRLWGTKLTLAMPQQLPYHVRWGAPQSSAFDATAPVTLDARAIYREDAPELLR